jgi:hypothetical protein
MGVLFAWTVGFIVARFYRMYVRVMVIQLLCTGSGFDLANSTPRFGFGMTFSVATISLTLCAGLFYASILKAQAETDADDKEYMRGK